MINAKYGFQLNYVYSGSQLCKCGVHTQWFNDSLTLSPSLVVGSGSRQKTMYLAAVKAQKSFGVENL
jgi:hypothetical protein